MGDGVQRWRRWIMVLLPTAGCLVTNPAWLGGEEGADDTGPTVDSTTDPSADGDADDDDGTVGPASTSGVTGTGGPGDVDTSQPPPASTDEPPPPDWWDTEWQYRRQVQVMLDTPVQRPVAVPIQIDNSDDPLRFAEFGRDVRFVTSSGEPVPHEIDTWQPLDGESAIVWLRLTPGYDAEPLYMYYGNPSATDGDGPAPVWLPEFNAVWHLASEVDSTMHNGDLGPEILLGPGLFGDGADFGADAAVVSTTFGDIVPIGATITAWIWPVSPGGQGEARIVDIAVPDGQVSVALHITSFLGQPNLAVTTTIGDTRVVSALARSPLAMGTWHFVAVTINEAVEVQLYLDGEGGTPDELAMEMGEPPMLMDSTIAIGGPISGEPQYFEGSIDEVRVRVDTLAAEDIVAEYMAQQHQAAQLGVEESL